MVKEKTGSWIQRLLHARDLDDDLQVIEIRDGVESKDEFEYCPLAVDDRHPLW